MLIRLEHRKLDGNAPAQVRIFGQIDLSHASLGEAFEDAVMRDYLSDHVFRSCIVKENEMTMPQDSESAVSPLNVKDAQSRRILRQSERHYNYDSCWTRPPESGQNFGLRLRCRGLKSYLRRVIV